MRPSSAPSIRTIGTSSIGPGRRRLRGEPYDIEHRIVVGGACDGFGSGRNWSSTSRACVLGGFGTTQDITERKLIEEERAQQARLKDEFLALLGHELRNPLAADLHRRAFAGRRRDHGAPQLPE